MDSRSNLSTGVAVAISCVVTFVVTSTVSAIITFFVTYTCVKRKFNDITQDTSGKQPVSTANTIVYDTVDLSSSNKGALEVQPNPAYGTSHKLVMDANPAYDSYK